MAVFVTNSRLSIPPATLKRDRTAGRQTCSDRVGKLRVALAAGLALAGWLASVPSLAVSALPELGGIVKIAAGDSHTCALTTAGGVKCWGSNLSGQLGDNSNTSRLTAVDVWGLTSGVADIAAGSSHTCALTSSGGVKCWGYNAYGQLGSTTNYTELWKPADVSGLATGVTAIAAGRYHTCAILAAGGMKCWGDNTQGQLGDNSTTQRRTPVDVSGLASGVAALAAGGYHTCASTSLGGAKCWGYNANGQLGDNSTTQRLTPVDVSGLASGVVAIVTGVYHGCALTTGGGVKCWGNNSSGQLGDNSTTQRLTPVDVGGLSSGVAAISTGSAHTCAVTTGGGVKCWGNNGYGQLGDNSTANRMAPIDVSGLANGVMAIAAGGYHSCALAVAGGVKCWGWNRFGQLGDDTASYRMTPVDVPALSVGTGAISAGLDVSCALTTAGGAKCWGYNAYGQLGDNSTTQRLTPVDVSGLASGVVAIVTGGNHGCALTTAGGVKCWGNNNYGQLGDNSTTQRLTPVEVTGLGSGVAAIAVGDVHSCALTTAGGVKCWGFNLSGQLGDNSTTQRMVPVNVSGLSSGVVAISAGGTHTCALITGGGVKCWGNNNYGQLGDNSTTQRLTPGYVSGLASGVSAVEAGTSHTCALAAGGGARCWGDNSYGQLGDNTTTQRLTPVDVMGLASGVLAISAGGRHSCAVTAAGGVKCWGYNGYGQLGDFSNIQRLTPVAVTGLAGGAAGIATGRNHSCALITAGGVKCWGDDNLGQLGNNSTIPSQIPVPVWSLPSGVAAVAGGNQHTCALSTSGGVQCWGYNQYGQLGDNTTTRRLAPVDVSGLGSGVAAIAAGSAHTCALTTAGGVKCWGNNGYGQLGDNSYVMRMTPVDVSGLGSGVVAIAVGSLYSCALTAAGGVKCWGYNFAGQLGDNSTTNRPAPVDVSGLTSGVAAIATGNAHTCALTTAGGAKCWGYNFYGQLGEGTTTNRGAPVDVSGLASGVAAIVAGGYHTCAITTSGGVKCWGNVNNARQLTPIGVSGLESGIAALMAGDFYSCALTTAGGVKCWGENGWGQLGDNSTTTRWTPADVSGLSSGVAAIGAGDEHACAVTTAGRMACWGSNSTGQLGDGTSGVRAVPAPVLAIPGHSLGVTKAGSGGGTVTSLPPGIDCGSICSAVFDAGTAVTLMATPAIGSRFAGWSGGGCSGTAGCAVAVSAATTVTATFDLAGTSIPHLANISTRMQVLTGDSVLIGGFIIGGSTPKTVAVRARGPSMIPLGVPGVLANPKLDLYSGQTVIASNDDWGTALNAAAIQSSGFAPADPQESTILTVLNPGPYTAIVSGAGGGTGVGIVEVFEVDNPDAPLINIATRGAVLTGADVMIGGFIIQGSTPQTVVVRARGPSLAPFGITNFLANPMLQLFSGPTQIAVNDNWQDSPDAALILSTGFAPADVFESVIRITLNPGAYTAIVTGVGGGAGVGIVEVFAQ